MSNNHYLFVEKYRPSTIEECILPASVAKSMSAFVESQTMPNLLLHGPAGCGKTTSAKALCEQLGFETMVVNGSSVD